MHLWLNQGFAPVYHAIRLVKAGLGDAARLTASHGDPGSPVRAAADHFLAEPADLGGEAYVDWIRRQGEIHGITHLWPQRRAAALVRAAPTLPFSLIAAADAATLVLLGDKAATYAALAGAGVPIPAHQLARNAAELESGLRAVEEEGERPCVKPAVSTFGHGFRRVVAASDPLSRLLHNEIVTCGRDELLAMARASRRMAPFLVMPYLEGPEYSVDCLAAEGRLLRHVARRKREGSRAQYLMTSPEIALIAARITERFGLRAVFNIQLREHRGRLFLLEINARMSGGLAVSCTSGLNFPEWGIRLASGEDPAAVPRPVYGSLVAQIETPVRVLE